eukprot:scaffold33178_cov55-Attheya_sp.AAC.2
MKYISSLLLGAVAVASAQDIVDVAVSNGFTTLVAAVTAAGLVATLQGDGPFTVFAPDDDAFAALPVGLLEFLLEPDSKDDLTAVLLYHVLAGEVDSATAIGLDGSSVPTVGTENITISLMVDSLMINDATVIGADVEASNGVIHVIDKVLYPPSLGAPVNLYDLADEAAVFTTLLAAADATGVTESILKDKGPYTILAPTDDAFDKLPDGKLDALLNDLPTLTNILSYHVIPGRVTSTDAFASNGVVHIIDTVLLPPTTNAPTPKPNAPTPTTNIMDHRHKHPHTFKKKKTLKAKRKKAKRRKAQKKKAQKKKYHRHKHSHTHKKKKTPKSNKKKAQMKKTQKKKSHGHKHSHTVKKKKTPMANKKKAQKKKAQKKNFPGAQFTYNPTGNMSSSHSSRKEIPVRSVQAAASYDESVNRFGS